MVLSQLLARVEYELVKGSCELDIDEICIDNRLIKPGDLFVAIRGSFFDSHTVIPDVIRRGAVAVLFEHDFLPFDITDDQPVAIKSPNEREEKFADIKRTAKANSTDIYADLSCTLIRVKNSRAALSYLAAAYYDYPGEKMRLTAVTGTKGKTTVTAMLLAMYEEAGISAASIGTGGAVYGGVVHQLNNTSPDPLTLHRHLRGMLEAGCTDVILEVSSQATKHDRVSGLHFDFSLFLNIEEGDHVSPTEHKDFDDYLFCKSCIVAQGQTALLNADDKHLPLLLDLLSPKQNRCCFGHSSNADYRIRNEHAVVTSCGPGISFDVTGQLEGTFTVAMPGNFSAMNALAAIAAAHQLGLPIEAISAALLRIHVTGRLDMIYRSPALSVCIDFAHSGYSTEKLLKALRAYHPKRLVCVFGCGGNRDVKRREEMGRASGLYADLSIITSEHLRYESYDDILAGIMSGLKPTGGQYILIPERKKAINYAIMNSKPGDLIAIIGLGNERFQDIQGKFIPHSDADYAREVIAAWESRQSGQ